MAADNPGVLITYGVHDAMVAAVGLTVGEVRSAQAQVMNIPGNAMGVIAGRRVADDHVIQKGEQVEFIKEAGVKGGR